MSTSNLAFLEIAAGKGFGRVVLDIEHNCFAPDQREGLILAARKMGLGVYCKIEGPDPVWVQQALDLDVDGIIIPHIGGLADALSTLRTTKYPPLGSRSYAGGRTVNYSPPTDAYFADANEKTLCLPMIETAEALKDIDAILACPQVDGVFVGPFDLALTRGRGNYRFSQEDQDDIALIAKAAKNAGKPWWVPAWSIAEQKFASEHGAAVTIIAAEHQVLHAGLDRILGNLDRGSINPTPLG